MVAVIEVGEPALDTARGLVEAAALDTARGLVEAAPDGATSSRWRSTASGSSRNRNVKANSTYGRGVHRRHRLPRRTPRRVVGPGDELDRGLRPAPALDGVHTVVPGHGPVTDLGAVAALKGYFEHLTGEARRCDDAGLGPREATRAVKLGPYQSWSEPERLAINVNAPYETSAPASPPTW
jgi:hypothetical protein